MKKIEYKFGSTIRSINFENGAWTGTEHYKCIKYDRPNLTSKQITAWQTTNTRNSTPVPTPEDKYKVKVDNQNHKIKVENKFNSTVQQYKSKMYRLPESWKLTVCFL